MTAWLFETTYAVTILMLLVLAVRRPVAHYFGAGWAYALWLLPALRLVLPPLHLFGADMPTLLPPAAAVAVPDAGATAAAPGSVETALSLEPILVGVWAAGAALFLLWQAWSYLSFVRRLGIGSQVEASLAQDVGIIESEAVDGPLAIGLLDKWIVVPADFSRRYSPEEQRLALQHERVHHQREDIFWNMVALVVLALNWFNPVAYAAFRAFRADQELSCDAAVAAQASGAERHDYARALVKSASSPGVVAACPLNHAGQLKRRLKMMKEHRRSGLRALGGSTAVAALLLTGISVTEARSVEAVPAPAPEAAPQPARAALAPRPAPAPRAAPAPREAPAPRPPAAKAPKVAPAAKAPTPEPVAAPEPAPPAPVAVTVQVSGPVPHGAAYGAPQAQGPHAGQHFAYLARDGAAEVRIVRVRTARVAPDLEARLQKLMARKMALAGRSVKTETIIHNEQGGEE